MKTGETIMHLFRNIVLLALFGCIQTACYATTYYVSNAGSDSAAGTSAATPWQTVAKVNSAHLGSGDQVLFQSGGLWRELLVPNTGGLTFSSYGTGALPIISGA